MELKKNNTRILVFFLYLTVNIIAFILSCVQGYILVENYSFSFNVDNGALGFAYVIFSLLFITLLYIFFTFLLRPYNEHINITRFYENKKISISIFSIQTLFIVFNLYYGLNVAGAGEDVNIAPSLLRYFFVIFNPDILFLIYACTNINNQLYKVNCCAYFVSTLIRGWSGGVLFLLFIFLCRSDKINLKLILLFIICLLFAPFIMEIKWLIRSNTFDYNNIISEFDYGKSLGQFLEYLVYRLQQVTNVIYLIDRVEHISILYQDNTLVPYWGEFIGLKNLYQLYYPQAIPLGQWLGSSIENSLVSWNSNPGLAGWFIILTNYSLFYGGLFILITVTAIFFNVYFSIIIGRGCITGFSYILCILYLFPGWMGMYFNLIFYLIIWCVVIKILKV
ncbi:hypothetical protein DOE57_09505 [Salmonella enterica subsp. salamae serovar 56:b:[1,5]]|uniref:Wzy n=2 Tax=Salmonella enterica TaxID=28901 RepID=D7PF97_SALER|nr:oligosaccharide repeat unit polymerase [Salmonella enterica]ADI77005.1 Wzy [Salmonella enterica]AXC85533.1 hypothetical protein DOE57_09505 [Salmonella enterica subsp. salamae serovar 56:b:[1,5]]KSB59257.1 hypothetical protein LFZ48_17010 [Salmonella enterica subsp. salamae serovar 56:z10:e,n,x str. 1369-73]HCM2050229.1 oligosaccharide repeat unit polymerase [Salmonella enterica subsp. salamae serovar 56:z10:e,n,x]